MTPYLIALTALSVTFMLCFAGLRAWRGWLDLRRFELSRGGGPAHDAPEADTGVRIEVADLKERLRKLEAIANGVEL